MSLSVHIEGVKLPDEQWKKMKKAYDACRAAGVDPPEAVEAYFQYEPPDDTGVIVEEEVLEKLGAVTAWCPEGSSGFQLHLDKVPKDIKIIRFSVSR